MLSPPTATQMKGKTRELALYFISTAAFTALMGETASRRAQEASPFKVSSCLRSYLTACVETKSHFKVVKLTRSNLFGPC